MAFQQLQQRLASGSQASCSYAARPAAHRSQRSRNAHTPRCEILHVKFRSKQACRATDDDDDRTAAQIALDPRQDTVYDRMTFASNSTPDYEDPQWVERIDDWEGFWYGTEEDDLDFDEDLSPGERSEQSLERARMLVSQLGNLRKRADVEQMITGEVVPEPFYQDTYRTEDEMVLDHNFYSYDPNPVYDAIDLRALAEKRRARAALDAEWKQRESLLARPYSFTLSQRLGTDARLQSSEFDWIREEWTHEQIMDLIVGSGKFVHPDKVKARVLNPLLPMDFHNDIRVHVVPETEEFIKRIGHMATEEDIMYLQSAQEIQLHSKDFVDSTVVFEDPSGATYVDAPLNPWAEMKKAEDAEDLILFDQMVEKVASKQRAKEAAAAAAEAGEVAADEYELDDESLDPQDDVMGDGFSSFVAYDEDNAAGMLMYEDELDGVVSESDFVERDEAEEEEGEQQGEESS